MNPLYSFSAFSLVYPYLFCKSPRSSSSFPSTWARSSSVSLPHFCLTSPLISFHFPFRMSSFIIWSSFCLNLPFCCSLTSPFFLQFPPKREECISPGSRQYKEIQWVNVVKFFKYLLRL